MTTEQRALHTATLTINRDQFTVEFKCHAGPDDECRQAPDPGCDCERFSIEKRDGVWVHSSAWYVSEDQPIWHKMHSVKYCNLIEWVTNDDAGPEELYCGVESITLNDTPVEFIWEGDYYEWRAIQ
jgi:hypothetical protein